MAVHAVLTGLMNSIGAAKRRLTAAGEGDVYHALHQCEGILNGALNRHWRKSTRAKAKAKSKPKDSTKK